MLPFWWLFYNFKPPNLANSIIIKSTHNPSSLPYLALSSSVALSTSFFIILASLLRQALSQQTTSFDNIDCCPVKKVEGKESLHQLLKVRNKFWNFNLTQALRVFLGTTILLMLMTPFLTHASKALINSEQVPLTNPDFKTVLLRLRHSGTPACIRRMIRTIVASAL